MSRTVWKFGSRWSDWGDPNSKIADSVFSRYNIAFANTHAVLDARPGDLIALADGYQIVAIGEILSLPQEVEHIDIVVSNEDRKKYFDDGNVCGCIIRYHWLKAEQQFFYSKAGRFFHASGIEDQVNKLFGKLSNH